MNTASVEHGEGGVRDHDPAEHLCFGAVTTKRVRCPAHEVDDDIRYVIEHAVQKVEDAVDVADEVLVLGVVPLGNAVAVDVDDEDLAVEFRADHSIPPPKTVVVLSGLVKVV